MSSVASLVASRTWIASAYRATTRDEAVGSATAPVWGRVVCWTIGLYLVFNYGFMQLRLPSSGAGVPVAELVLGFALLFALRVRTVAVFASVIPVWPFVAWWFVGICRISFDSIDYGLWAWRDASNLIESLFIIVGLSLGIREGFQEYTIRWLQRVLAVAGIYALGYPFETILQEQSPKLIAGAGYELPLFFNFVNTAQMLLLAAAALSVRTIRPTRWRWVGVPILVAYAAAAFQARTIYLQIGAICCLLIVAGKGRIRPWLGAVVVFCAVLGIISATELELPGRLGQPISATFVIDHLTTIVGVEREGLEGSAGGVHQRFGWWESIIDRLTSGPKTLLVGLGYGLPLIDFESPTGASVREPHNSLLSTVARVGIIGVSLWLTMHAFLVNAWLKAWRRARRLGLAEVEAQLLLYGCYFSLIWILSFAEDGFEKPFNAISYYFLWGVTLAICSKVAAATHARTATVPDVVRR